MSDDPLERITELRREIDRARNERARKEAVADQADAVLKDSLGKLQELGLASPEVAEAEAERIRAELLGMVSEIEQKLREATG